MNSLENIGNIINALEQKEELESISVLDEIGTNSSLENVRCMTARALVNKNQHDSLKVVLINKGKGIHDMNNQVVEATINTLINLDDKSEAVRILNDTINLHSDNDVKKTALAVRELIYLSN